MVCHHRDSFLASSMFKVSSFSYDHGDAILGFYLILAGCFFGFSLLKHHPSLFICSFCFLSLGPYPRFYVCSILVTLVSNSWHAILGSTYKISRLFLWLLIFVTLSMGCHPCFCTRFLSKAYFFVPFVFRHRNTVLGSNYVEFLFIWFPIIRIWSYVLPRISRLFLSFLVIVTPSWFLSMFVLSSFGFQTFGCHPTFYRFIVRSSYFQSLGSHPKLYLWLFICSLDLSSLGTHPRLYVCSL